MGYENNSIFWVEVEKIVPNPYQPRREFDEEKLKELSESIRMYGILQPLTVSRREVVGEGGAFRTEYELVAGERRLRASKLGGLTQVPVIIRTGEESELMKLELAIIENLQREDLSPVDRGLAFKQLAEQFKLSHSQVAKKVGRSREYVSNSIRLLLLPDYMLESLKLRDISEGHARTLLMLNDRPEEQDVLFREILLKKLSVREVEKLARKVATDKVRKHQWKDTDPELMAIEKEFTETLGTRVQIAKTEYGGKLTIDYFSAEDLQKLLQTMQGGEEAESSPEDVSGSKNSSLTQEDQSDHSKEMINQIAQATPLERTEKDETASIVEREMAEIRAQAAKEREAERLVHVDERESLLDGAPEGLNRVQEEEDVPNISAAEGVSEERQPSPEVAVNETGVFESDEQFAVPGQDHGEDTTVVTEDLTPQDSPDEHKEGDDNDSLYSVKHFTV